MTLVGMDPEQPSCRMVLTFVYFQMQTPLELSSLVATNQTWTWNGIWTRCQFLRAMQAPFAAAKVAHAGCRSVLHDT